MVARRLFPVLVVLMTASACASSTLPRPVEGDAEALARDGATVSLAELEQGRDLTARSCGGCHALKSPHALPPAEWPSAVESMRTKQGVVLSDAEAATIVAYLQGVALRP